VSGQRRTLSKSSNYLDTLATTLRDLGGPNTIPHELAQNADDAGNATTLRFTVTNDALLVWNDGTFTDCGKDTDTCPWEKRCDLHAFRRFAGRTKAQDTSTTGAFGVGFTSVYQITDAPELLYGEEHWFLDETAAENERLRFCDGDCGREHNQSGTSFVLPWARAMSPLREALAVPPVGEAEIAALEAALISDTSRTLMFLQNVRKIEIATRARTYTATRYPTEGGFVIADDQRESRWLTLRADFADTAQALIARAGGLINPDRSAAVTIAISADGDMRPGVLFATLPTESPSGLPGHVNASFYPKTDRKSVRFDTGYESEWNRAAIEAVGKGLACAAEQLADAIGITQLWELLGAIAELDRRGEHDQVNHAAGYLQELRLVVPDLEVVETVHGGRTTPRRGLLPADLDLYASSDAFTCLAMPVVAQHLHRRLHTDNVYAAYALRLLTTRHVVDAVSAAGLTQTFQPSGDTLSRDEMLSLLDALERLPGKVSNVEGIEAVAIVPCRGGQFAPADAVLWPGSDSDGTLFELLVDGLLVADVATVEQRCPGLKDVCEALDIVSAATALREANLLNLEALAGELLDWLNRNLTTTVDEASRAALAQLPIFPTAEGFEQLTKLSLPNEFRDPVGVASLVADQAALDYHKLLVGLGARPLDVVDYFALHALPAIQEGAVSVDQATELLRLVAAHQIELEPLQTRFAEAKIVPCLDGALHLPTEVHFPSQDIKTLAPELPVAETSAVPPAVLDWLGVARAPSDEALAIAVDRLAAEQGEPDTGVIEAVLRTLQSREELPGEPPAFLAASSWLPRRRGGWARPNAVLPTNARQLYGSQGAELGIPADMQGRFFRQLTWLGMPSEPPVSTIVAHLRHCSEHGLEMHPDVYRVLSNNVDEATVRSLKDVACVYVGSGRFVPPATAFWRPSPFGRWGATLPESWLPYKPFFDAVGVKQEAGPNEVAAVLRAILAEFGNDPLDEPACEVVHGCWVTLSNLLEHHEPAGTFAALGHLRTTVDPRGLLARPDQLYFEDSRALHRRFPQLAHNVIPRVHGTWPALVEAGVRRVEELIKAKLVDVAARPDSDLPARIADRIGALHRVFEDEELVDGLEAITVMQAPALSVIYRAELFGHPFEIGPEPVDAIYLPHEDALYYADGASPRALARELARAIAPDEDPGPLAMRLEPILTASSAEEAHAALDDYGIAKLDVTHHDVEWAPTAEQGDNHSDIDDDQAAGGVTPEDSQEQSDGEEPVEPSADEERGQRGSGPGSGSSGRGEGGDRKRKERATAKKGPGVGRQTRLRSYVVESDEDEGDIGTIGDEAPDLSPIDLAGVQRVLEYERSCGREPKEMAHNNAGFDVESFDKRGQLVRRIEIKSTGGQWSVAGVMVSRRQHQQAVEDGDLFWLYVVENAQDTGFRIYRVQNPASRIDYFGFDDGWKSVAEPEVERDGEGTPTAVSTRSLLSRSPGGAVAG
jgi:hypothetical protein